MNAQVLDDLFAFVREQLASRPRDDAGGLTVNVHRLPLSAFDADTGVFQGVQPHRRESGEYYFSGIRHFGQWTVTGFSVDLVQP